MSLQVTDKKPRRYRNAKAAQAGACNPIAIANGLVDAMRECRDEGADHDAICKDAGVRLIAHQLAYLLNLSELDQGRVYTQLVDDVEAKIAALG